MYSVRFNNNNIGNSRYVVNNFMYNIISYKNPITGMIIPINYMNKRIK